MLEVNVGARSLLATWTYSNPPLDAGAMINGYRVYVNGLLTDTTEQLNSNVSGLTPFTNYTVEVSAFNQQGDGTEQEGPRSEPVTETTLEDCK